MVQLDINQASGAIISSLPLLPAPKVTIVFRKASYKNMQCTMFVKKWTIGSLSKNVLCRKGQ